MAKDPAVLFYYQDFLVGTEFMTNEEVGKYIRVLCHQADKGSLTESQLKSICNDKIPESIREKLSIDSEGKYYQERMRLERAKRDQFCEKQKNRIEKRWNDKNTAVLPITGNTFLENENENENENRNENRNEKNKRFIAPTLEELKLYFKENGYSEETAIKAFNYYSIADWHDSKGMKIKNWKQKMQAVWFKPENKIKSNISVDPIIQKYKSITENL